eukprot:COSAG02_NODE_3899_length_6067_cov_9.009383_2_plen_157_part_00
MSRRATHAARSRALRPGRSARRARQHRRFAPAAASIVRGRHSTRCALPQTVMCQYLVRRPQLGRGSAKMCLLLMPGVLWCVVSGAVAAAAAGPARAAATERMDSCPQRVHYARRCCTPSVPFQLPASRSAVLDASGYEVCCRPHPLATYSVQSRPR